MYSKNISIIRIYICFTFLIFLMISCKKETFKYYSFNFYPVEEINNSGSWVETDFLSSGFLSFRLNSLRILEEFHDFEEINISTCNFYSDKDFIVNSDTIKSGENLLSKLDQEMIFFERHIGGQGAEYSWYYLIIKSTDSKKINILSDYYQFNIKGYTENGYEINDSLLVKYNKPLTKNIVHLAEGANFEDCSN